MAPVKRHPQKSAGHRARPITPEPVTAPVATRAWCVRDSRKLPNNSATSRLRRFKPAPRPKKFIAIRTKCAASTTASMPGFEGERWASAGQALVFGCAVIGRTADWRIDREVIFYPDDLPESGVVALRKYVQELTWRLGARPRKEGDPEPDLIWRDETRLGTKSTDAASRSNFCRYRNSSSSSIASPTKMVRSSLDTIFPASSRASLRTGARLKRARRSAGGSSLSGPTGPEHWQAAAERRLAAPAYPQAGHTKRHLYRIHGSTCVALSRGVP